MECYNNVLSCNIVALAGISTSPSAVSMHQIYCSSNSYYQPGLLMLLVLWIKWFCLGLSFLSSTSKICHCDQSHRRFHNGSVYTQAGLTEYKFYRAQAPLWSNYILNSLRYPFLSLFKFSPAFHKLYSSRSNCVKLLNTDLSSQGSMH